MGRVKDTPISNRNYIFDGNGKTFETKYELERAFSLTVQDMTFNQINRAVTSTMKNKLSKPNNNSIWSGYMNVPKQCLKDIGKIKSSEVYNYCCVTPSPS